MKNAKNLPEISFSTNKKNRIKSHFDRYDSDTVEFAIWWAHLMEKEIDGGGILDDSTIKKCALLAKKKVPSEVTEYVRTNAACFLNAVWKYYEAIYRWQIEVNRKKYGQEVQI